MNLAYKVKDKPKFGATLIFALQQLLAILAATIAVPAIIGNGMSQSAALFGAGVGTLVYLCFTKFRSPVFLGSSFAFIPSMTAAFAGGISMHLGYLGLIIGAALAGLVYVIIAIIVKLAGVKWIDKVMPAVVIGPTVAIIGLSLAGNAVANSAGFAQPQGGYMMNVHTELCLLCALITLFTVIICSVYGKKMGKLIPFIIGILAGYVAASILTVIGIATEHEAMEIINFSVFKDVTVFSVPDFTFLTGAKGFKELNWHYIATLAVAYIPVAFVVFAEHIADHKNLSSIIGSELLENPGLHRTLLGDGVGSAVGALFGGCPNTTYGESVGCVAITGNASVVTILATAIMAIVVSFFDPFVTFLASIPTCVMGSVCITLYGFIAVSGLKMIQKVDLGDNGNLFTVAVILICGIGGMSLSFPLHNATGSAIIITNVAVALILGIITNLIVSKRNAKKAKKQ